MYSNIIFLAFFSKNYVNAVSAVCFFVSIKYFNEVL